MGAIDIGYGAVDGDSTVDADGYTFVDIYNPGNDSGSLSSFEIWANVNLTGTKMGAFSGNPPNFDDRDYETIGNVAAGSKQTFTGLTCDVTSGDYIGIFYSTGDMERDFNSGNILYEYPGDRFGQGSIEFDEHGANVSICIYATGTTGVEDIDETYIDGIALDDLVEKEVRKIIADGFDVGDSLLLEVRKIIADGYALADTLIAAKILSRILTDGIAIADTLLKRVEVLISDGVTFTDTLIMRVEAVIAEGISIGDSLLKRVEKVISDGVALTDIAHRFLDRVLTDGIAFTDCLTRWRWLTAIRNLIRRRCNLDAVRNQDSVDDGNI